MILDNGSRRVSSVSARRGKLDGARQLTLSAQPVTGNRILISLRRLNMKKLFTIVLLIAFALLANMSLVTADMHGWWADAAAPYAGTTIRGVSESTPPSNYVADVLAAQFTELTGINDMEAVVGDRDFRECSGLNFQDTCCAGCETWQESLEAQAARDEAREQARARQRRRQCTSSGGRWSNGRCSRRSCRTYAHQGVLRVDCWWA